MPTLNEIGQEKQRLAERLAKLDGEREKIAAQLNELEVAERVLARFGGGETAERRRRGRPARAPAAAEQPPRRARGAPRAAQPSAPGVSLSEAALQAVGAHSEGLTANEILGYLAHELGLTVRPNHLGIALQRHRRGGRLEMRDSRWFLPQHAQHGSAPAETEAVSG
jgi:hypothetical protein